MNKMSDQEKVFVKRRLREYLLKQPNTAQVPKSICTICHRYGVDEFEVLGFRADRFYASAMLNNDKRTPTIPVVVVSCPGCGLMLAFDAVTLGICDADTGCLVDGWDAEAREP